MKKTKIVRSKCSICSDTLKSTGIQINRVEHFYLYIKFQMFQMFRWGRKWNKRNKAEQLISEMFHPLINCYSIIYSDKKGVEQMERIFAQRLKTLFYHAGKSNL